MKHMKELAGEYFKGKKLHIVSNCIIQYDVSGTCVDYKVKKDELVLVVSVNNKYLEVGENQKLVKIEIIGK